MLISVLLYLVVAISQLGWGLPNENHPFSYHMDEWAQLRALKTTFTQGTPHVPGSGDGTFFFYLQSAAALAPFILTKTVDISAVKTSLHAIDTQRTIFEILRLQNIAYIISASVLTAFIAKKYLKASSNIAAFILLINPLVFMLSVLYRYDPPVPFWILLSLLFSFRFLERPSPINLFLSAFVSAIAVTIKVSLMPLFLALVASYLLSTDRKKNLKVLLLSTSIFWITFILFGIPYALVSYRRFIEWVYISAIANGANPFQFRLSLPYPVHFLLFEYPATFGKLAYTGFLLGLGWWILKYRELDKFKKFIVISLALFYLSIISLRFGGTGNRMFVILPFVALINSELISRLLERRRLILKKIVLVGLGLILIIQSLESLSWFSTKIYPDPRETSSQWIKANITSGSSIGLGENPLYQDVPDFILLDYYRSQYDPRRGATYSYSIVDDKSPAYPAYVIVTWDKIHKTFAVDSSKKRLVSKLEKLGYQKIQSFSPDHRLFRIFNPDPIQFFSTLSASPSTISIYYKPKGVDS